MEEENNVKDQVQEDIQEDETSKEQSAESNEPITPEKAYELAKGLQKGYTLTRQELAEIRENIGAIQSALEEIRSSKTDEFGDEFETEKPLTKKDIIEAITEIEKQKARQEMEKEAMVDRIIDDLKFEGVVKNDAEADDLIKFTLEAAKSAGLKEITPDYILSVVPAWQKAKEAEEIKQQIKGKVKEEIGSKVGNSEKTSAKEQGISWKEVHFKDWDEL